MLPTAKVVWQVKNPNGDRLAKIGKGTLEINGTGVNQGQLKVGDGTVILNQKADADKKFRLSPKSALSADAVHWY